jgi:Leucine Rich repeats (2 copies)
MLTKSILLSTAVAFVRAAVDTTEPPRRIARLGAPAAMAAIPLSTGDLPGGPQADIFAFLGSDGLFSHLTFASFVEALTTYWGLGEDSLMFMGEEVSLDRSEIRREALQAVWDNLALKLTPLLKSEAFHSPDFTAALFGQRALPLSPELSQFKDACRGYLATIKAVYEKRMSGTSAIITRADPESDGELDLTFRDIEDITQLSGYRNLQGLCLDGNSGLQELSPLIWMRNLKRLRLDEVLTVSDISALAGLTRLKKLGISEGLAIVDWSPVAKLTQLQTLVIVGMHIDDISFLRQLTNLEKLDLAANPIDDFSPLQGLTKLRSLELTDTDFSDLSLLSRMTGLTRLLLGRSAVIDLAPLAAMSVLKELDLSETRVFDVRPLSGLTSLRELIIADSAIDDLSPLEGLEHLEIGEQDEEDD